MSKPKSIEAPTDEQIEEDIELLHRLQAMPPEKRAQLQASIDALTVAYEEMLVAQEAEREIEEAYEAARKTRDEALKALREGRVVSVRSRSAEDRPDDDAGLVGYLLVASALRRRESRGGHTRTDYPQAAPVVEHVLISEADLEGEF